MDTTQTNLLRSVVARKSHFFIQDKEKGGRIAPAAQSISVRLGSDEAPQAL